MSNYTMFVREFPTRAGDLLSRFERRARWLNREVTLMLTVAMPLIIVPLERLKAPRETPNGPKPGHPGGDWARFHEARGAIEALRQAPFLGSPIWPNRDDTDSSWCFGTLASAEGTPDAWPELQEPRPLSRQKTVGPLLTLMRNALAHGNIATEGRNIERIIFVANRAEDSDRGFYYLTVSPDDFREFLGHWIQWLENIPLPAGIMAVAPDAA